MQSTQPTDALPAGGAYRWRAKDDVVRVLDSQVAQPFGTNPIWIRRASDEVDYRVPGVIQPGKAPEAAEAFFRVSDEKDTSRGWAVRLMDASTWSRTCRLQKIP